MHGVKRVLVFCTMIVILPATLIIMPLYLRKTVFADVTFPVAESDIIEIREGISSIFCEQHTLRMSSNFNAFQLRSRPEISTNRKHIRLKKSMTLPDDTLEYWGFYLLKGAKVHLKFCSRYDGSRILVVKGQRELHTCGLLEHNNKKLGANFAQGHEQVKVFFEEITEIVVNTPEMARGEIHENMKLKSSKTLKDQTLENVVVEAENHAGEDLDVDEVQTTITTTTTTARPMTTTRRHKKLRSGRRHKTHIKQQKQQQQQQEQETDIAIKSQEQKTQQKQQEITQRLSTSLSEQQTSNATDDATEQQKTNKHKSHTTVLSVNESTKNIVDHLQTTSDNQQKLPQQHQQEEQQQHQQQQHRQRRQLIYDALYKKRDKRDRIYDRKYSHGGNALNFTETDESNSISSFENGLFDCFNGAILLAEGFPPSHDCHNAHFLENGSHRMLTKHDITEDGYYYYIFYSDNDLVRNDIHAIFDIYKPTFQYSNISDSQGCLNSTNCTFNIGFLSDEIVVVEVPTRDGIEHEEDDITYLISTCHPRAGIYAIFPILVLILILSCSFL